MPQHIAIIEDEIAIAENYRDSLQKLGYRVSVYRDRVSAESGCEQQMPDLAIIDVGLGSEVEGGFTLCRNWRARSPELPIMFLTARDAEVDIISGFRLGADDYLTKDISQAHMHARVIALLRRVHAKNAPVEQDDILERGPLSLNLQRMTVSWLAQNIELTVTEFWITHALARNPGHVKSRDQLMNAAKMVVEDNTLTSHIQRIRRKFKAVDPDFKAIKTSYSMGYSWSGL